MGTLISIIINVYNGEKFINKCLNSVINQTYKNIEILIINDGSTDKTLSICKSYTDKRIRIISQENTGLSIARNVGIENAKGEYIYFLDADDFIEIDTIEYLYKLCQKYNTKMSTCKTQIIYNYDFKVKKTKEKSKVYTSYEMLKKVLLSKDETVTIWNKLYKKELFNNIRFENRIINDKTVTHKLTIKAEKIAFGNQIKYYYLKHKDATTIKNKDSYERTIDMYKVSIERYEYIKRIYSNFLENDIGLIRAILKIYLVENEKVRNFSKNEKLIEKFNKLFKFKILITNIGFKEKIKILTFKISPKIYILFGKCYRNKKYKYKLY